MFANKHIVCIFSFFFQDFQLEHATIEVTCVFSGTIYFTRLGSHIVYSGTTRGLVAQSDWVTMISMSDDLLEDGR